MRTIRIDLSIEDGDELSKFLEGLDSAGYLISFEKGMVTTKDHWQGWIEWTPLQKDDTMYRKLTKFAKDKGLTQGQYAFSIMNNGEEYFSYICKHKGKDFYKKYTSYADDVLQAQYDKADQWLSKQEYVKELKKVPIQHKILEECKKRCLYRDVEHVKVLIRYDLIRDQVTQCYSDYVKAFDHRIMLKACIGVANYFEKTYKPVLLHRAYVNRHLAGLEKTPIEEIFYDDLLDKDKHFNYSHFSIVKNVPLVIYNGLSSETSDNQAPLQASS